MAEVTEAEPEEIEALVVQTADPSPFGDPEVVQKGQ
jgi:hypothetical protein